MTSEVHHDDGASPNRNPRHDHPSPPHRIESSAPGPPPQTEGCDSVTVDCDRCSMRGIGCGDCVITVLLGGPPFGVALDAAERRAIDVLAAAGLVPPLRMVEALDERHVEPA